MDVETFTVLTTTPNVAAALVHDRMPVVLAPEAWERWLAPGPPPMELDAPVGNVRNDTVEATAATGRHVDDGER